MQSLRPNCGEQLVYVAAFAVAARILYGDLVKHTVYRRLYDDTTLQDLDYAFGVQVNPPLPPPPFVTVAVQQPPVLGRSQYKV